MSLSPEELNRIDELILAGLPQPDSSTFGCTVATPSSGFTESTLKQALDDEKAARATALANASSALARAFTSGAYMSTNLEGESKSLNDVNDDVAEAIEDAKPEIMYPGWIPTVKPAKVPKVNKNGDSYAGISVPLAFNAYSKSPVLDSHGNPSPANNISITGSYVVSPSNAPLFSTSSSYLIPSSGAAIQPSLNQKTTYSFNVSIGKPTLEKIIINCVENSRDEAIHFSKNPEVIWEAVEKFNELYDPATKSKIILAGGKKDYVNIQLVFSKLVFDGLALTVEFKNYGVVDSKGVFDYPKCIAETCSFFLEGEVYLNEDETDIIEASINSLNYVNIFRFDTVERVTYIH